MFRFKAAAATVLAASLLASSGYGSEPAPPAKRHTTTTKKAKKPAPPRVEEQINALRQELQTQIDSLKTTLSEKDAQLKQAQQAAADAQAAAAQAQQTVSAQNQAVTENAAAVATLQSNVTDLKGNQLSLATTVSDETSKIKATMAAPDSIHFKGITLSPTGSFVEFATVGRTRGTASDIPTPFTAIPLTAANAGQLSEFEMTGRQSRIALNAEGKVSNATIRGYYEADWLGTGVTSNNNQSNSYVMRQRQIWAQAQLNNGWTFTGGQMWSLATEYSKGLLNKNEAVPLTIDPNYQAGFVWTRNADFRVVKSFSDRMWLGLSLENAQTLAPSCQAVGTGIACPTNYLYAATGTGSGLYNGGDAAGGTSPLTTYAYNLAPDLIAKLATDNSLGHFEVFGIARFFRDRVYPHETAANAGTAAGAVGAYNDSTVGGGVGGSARFRTFQKKIDIGVKGLWGDGVGRYGTTTLPDVTVRPNGSLTPLHQFSAMGFIEGYVTPRLQPYVYYGGEYAGRDIFTVGAGQIGYGLPGANNSGCGVEVAPGTGVGTGTSPATPGSCAGSNKDVQEGTAGWWYNFYAGPHGRLRQSFQYSWIERNLWSGTGGLAAGSPGVSPKAIDNIFETSFRYYLP